RRSSTKSVSQCTWRASRISALRWSSPPIASSAARRASSGDRPLAIPSSIRCSRWNRSSSSISLSTRRRRKIDRIRRGAVYHQCSGRMWISSRLRESDHLRDGRRQPPPVRRLRLELLPPDARQRVELRLAFVLGLLPLRADPPFLLELVQCRIERALRDLQ